jgi:hypothetical protein
MKKERPKKISYKNLELTNFNKKVDALGIETFLVLQFLAV